MKKDEFSKQPAFAALKGAQRDLIAHVGGIDKASRLVEKSISVVGDWNNFNKPDLMGQADIVILEAALGRPVVSRAIALWTGATVVDPSGSAAARACLHSASSGLILDYGDFLARFGDAAEDGKFTLSELYVLRPSAERIRRSSEGLISTIDRKISAALQPTERVS